MADYTDINILLDRSGSMSAIKSAMESGLDEFLYQHKQVPTTRISLVQFDGQNPYDEVYIERPVTDVPKLHLQPRGSTPLLDALCMTIDKVGRRLAAKQKQDRPDRVLFVIITDGQENASHEFKREDVRRRVNTQTDTYKWEFVYLGANQDAFAEAASFGIDFGKTMNFAYAVQGTKNAWRSLTTNTLGYASGAAAAVADYNSVQRNEAMETDDLKGSKATTK